MRARHALLLGLLFAVSLCLVHGRTRPIGPYKHAKRTKLYQSEEDLLSRCTLNWRNATLNNFYHGKNLEGQQYFPQRYYVCDEFWNREKPGPVFFYLGNEGDVTLYLNHTGLMWESAPAFEALLVFAEHRYYGLSKPSFTNLRKHMGYLSTDQAMADYAELIWELKTELGAQASPVIGFGGSYGGMLGTFFRIKYPHLMDGVIAGSAPIWDFLGEEPPADPTFYAKGVTYDASSAGGSAPACIPNVKKGWKVLLQHATTPEGRHLIRSATKLCDSAPLDSVDDVLYLRDWMASAWDYMAMGNFPYPSSYILNGDGDLPPYPVRVACSKLAQFGLSDQQLLAGMSAAAGVFYNYSGDVSCFDYAAGANPDTDDDADFWGYQWCTEMFMPDERDGDSDMFWPERFDVDGAVAGCKDQWGVAPKLYWATIDYGGKALQYTSNIVFSNGLLDPWHGGGVLYNLSDSLVSVIIPEGAHHLDLMFSHPLDPPSVTQARETERAFIAKWVAEAYERSRPGPTAQQQAAAGDGGPEVPATAASVGAAAALRPDSQQAGWLRGKAAANPAARADVAAVR